MAAIGRFGPPVALMALIFVFSAQPDVSSGLGTLDTIGRKLTHMVEYGLLWWLWWRALGFGHPVPSIAVTLAYAASDEWHQTFVTGRVGVFSDWAIDAAGVGLAGLVVVLRARRRRAVRSGSGPGPSGRAGDTAPREPAPSSRAS
jgi:VanZ family protein